MPEKLRYSPVKTAAEVVLTEVAPHVPSQQGKIKVACPEELMCFTKTVSPDGVSLAHQSPLGIRTVVERCGEDVLRVSEGGVVNGTRSYTEIIFRNTDGSVSVVALANGMTVNEPAEEDLSRLISTLQSNTNIPRKG